MDTSALETFKAIARQLSVPERWFGDNEISPVIVKSEGLDDSLEVPANLDDTLITPRAACFRPPSQDRWAPPAACPQALTNCVLPNVSKTSPVLFSSTLKVFFWSEEFWKKENTLVSRFNL